MISHFDLHDLGEPPSKGRVSRSKDKKEAVPKPVSSPPGVPGFIVVIHSDGSYTDVKGVRRGGRGVSGINWQWSH